MSNREQYIKKLQQRVIDLEWHEHQVNKINHFIKCLELITDEEYDREFKQLEDYIINVYLKP